MKKLTSSLSVWILINLVFSTFIFLPSAYSQNVQKPLYAVADYMKVNPENINNYLELEQRIWKPMHAERVRLGIILGWYLYAINFTRPPN